MARRRVQREADCEERRRRSSLIQDMGAQLQAEKMVKLGEICMVYIKCFHITKRKIQEEHMAFFCGVDSHWKPINSTVSIY